MPSPGWEDLNVFFEVEDFATTALFSRGGEPTSPQVKGIFDDPYYDKQLGEYSATEGDPRLTCKEVDVAQVKKHDECLIASMPGRKYTVIHDPKFDGTGTCVVYLGRVE
ncbi:MAG: hypothetical protein GAK31_00942 [Stenotrophomonas maltophilia]|uniref:Phage protein n=1 Tax=Stenotrophomonas maltophilia TaxID=40324 RepID=A0A7V8FKE9_STEMA|nr:MAG: hypothetical protein GAK31_00942 [Stenotrophomonas maltophilia]